MEAAGIPCYVELIEDPPEPSSPATQRLRAMVPGNFNLQAASVLERDTFNNRFEAEWKTHLATLSDEELTAITPEAAFCGLFDRVERVKRAYAEEFAHRDIKQLIPNSPRARAQEKAPRPRS